MLNDVQQNTVLFALRFLAANYDQARESKLVDPASRTNPGLGLTYCEQPVLVPAAIDEFCEDFKAGDSEMAEAELFVQFHAIYTGRVTYNNDAEWIANLDASMEELCEAFGMSFAPQENLRSCIVTNLVESAEAVLTLLEDEGRDMGAGGPLSELRDDIAAAKGEDN